MPVYICSFQNVFYELYRDALRFTVAGTWDVPSDQLIAHQINGLLRFSEAATAVFADEEASQDRL